MKKHSARIVALAILLCMLLTAVAHAATISTVEISTYQLNADRAPLKIRVPVGGKVNFIARVDIVSSTNLANAGNRKLGLEFRECVYQSDGVDYLITYLPQDTNHRYCPNTFTVQGLAPGTFTILIDLVYDHYTVSANGTAPTLLGKYYRRAWCRTEVEVYQPVTSVSVPSGPIEVKVGKTASMGASAMPANAENRALTYTSSNTAVATVNANGVITGKKYGTATITATAADGSGKKATRTVNVKCATHSSTNVAAIAATCTQAGKTAGTSCSVCKTVLSGQTTIAALGHKRTKLPAVAATCTATGLTEGEMCSQCKTVFTAQQTVPMTEHRKVDMPAVAPSCTNTGLTKGVKCGDCGKVFTAQQTVPMLDHSETADKGYAPGCEETGLTDGSHCSVCGKVLTAQQIIPATGHSFEFEQDIYETTAEEAVYMNLKSLCGHQFFTRFWIGDGPNRNESNGLDSYGMYGGFIDYEHGVSKVTAISEDDYETKASCYVIVYSEAPAADGGGLAYSLPAGLEEIREEAFAGLDLNEVIVPEHVQYIGDRAFLNCEDLRIVFLPDDVRLGEDVFKGCDEELTIICSEGSEAEAYARANGIACLPMAKE